MTSTSGDEAGTRSGLSRRAVLRSAGAAAAVATPMVNFGRFRAFAASGRTYSARTIDLVNRSLVIDMLSIISDLGDALTAGFSKTPRLLDNFPIDDAQVAKLRSTGINIYHPAAGLGGYEEGLAFVARLNGYAAERPDVFRRVDRAADMASAKADGKIGYIIGIQNSEHFETVDHVNEFYILGQRISQLTYNTMTRIGSGSTDRADGGISDFGAAIVQRMNEIGMAVDVSHCGDRTTLDAFDISKKPVLITHSNVRALAGGHPRCKSDDAIRAVGKAGGVMGITGVRNFVRDREPTTVEHMVDHFDYVAKMIGVEHVGIGSDMDPDGYDDIPEPAYGLLKRSYKESYKFRGKLDTDGFDHPKKIYDLTEALIRRGYSDANIELILGGNFKRVLGEIWKG